MTAELGAQLSTHALYWLGPELARMKLLRNEEWVLDSSKRVVGLFPNQGVHAAATLIAVLHPLAVQYLEQAPVLVLGATHGGSVKVKATRKYVCFTFGPMFERGIKLRELMEACKLPFPLRRLSAKAMQPSLWRTIEKLRLVDNSTLAQAIPADQTKHLNWLRALSSWETRLEMRGFLTAQRMRWAALAFSREPWSENVMVPGEVADFAISNPSIFNERWTWSKAVAETMAWHEALAKMQFDASARGSKQVADYGDWPDETSVGGFEFVALKTARDLFIEGRVMHHCVHSYGPDIMAGRCRIYSIRKEGKRIATAEYASHGPILQLKGPCNCATGVPVQKAASAFAKRWAAYRSDLPV